MTVPPQDGHRLDLSGKFCPEVVLCVKSYIETLPAGARLTVISTDPLSGVDIPLFARRTGLTLLRQSREGGSLQFELALP